MLATVRNRRGLIASVEAYDAGAEGRLHLVDIEYTDGHAPASERLLWETEVSPIPTEPNVFPEVFGSGPMGSDEFDALIRATRWSALSPFVAPGKPHDVTPSAPLFGAVRVDDFQLHPLLKALQMPRVSLLIADDVGLGKTIEAGLILNELLLRRRVRRVLVLCPANLRHQWQQEMHEKFSIHFDVIDRQETLNLQKRLGLDANPWRSVPRSIASYHYFKQPDVLEQFRAACQQPDGSAQLPWDLLIVDEAHNLMPSPFGQDSDLARMLREISPWFEHKLFLTATPHNGHTRSFSGLLEQLDPVRFTQKSELAPSEKQRLQQVVVRRLKRDINAQDEAAGRTPRFAERHLEPVPLFFGSGELALMRAFAAWREKARSVISRRARQEQLAGTFAVEILNKRLLSSPVTFADSWWRFRDGIDQGEAADLRDVEAAQRAVRGEGDDDTEAEVRSRHASATTGAWFRPLAAFLEDETTAVDRALAELDLIRNRAGGAPREDTRFERLKDLIDRRLRDGPTWLDSERLIVFTEYKTTLDYLEARLTEAYESERVLVLYGGMDDAERERVKEAFNDPDHPVRVLLATDAASEGLNLQHTARLLLHYEIPWNPSRLEQRNGRLDRHGQARDVTVFHFTSDQDADLRFLGKVVGKVNRIREDLGSMGEVFDAAFQRRFVDLGDTEQVERELDGALQAKSEHKLLDSTDGAAGDPTDAAALDWLKRELDLRPETLVSTLNLMLGVEERGDGLYHVRPPVPAAWEPTVDEHLRLGRNGARGPLPRLAFDPQRFIQIQNGRPVFRTPKDARVLHLGHPVFRRMLAEYAQRRFTGTQHAATRWTVRRGPVPPGMDAMLLLTVEELAVNDLRETFHHWVRTLRFPVQGDRLGTALEHQSAADDAGVMELDTARLSEARLLWEEVEEDARQALRAHAANLSGEITGRLSEESRRAVAEAKELFDERISEAQKAMRETSLERLRKEIEDAKRQQQQGALFAHIDRELQQQLENLEEELARRRSHYQTLVEQLKAEKERVLKRLLPRRYALRDEVRVLPLTVEIRFPGAQA